MNPLPSFTRRVAQLAVAGLRIALRRARLVLVLGAAACGCPCPMRSLFQVVLQQIAAIVHRLGRLDLEAHPVRQLVDLAEDLFELLAGEQIAQLAATHRNQEEHVPHHDGQLFKQSAEVVEVVRVVAADGGVHLDRNARLVGPLRRPGWSAPTLPAVRGTCRESPGVEPSSEIPSRTTPASFILKMASRVSSGVALGVTATLTPFSAA